jgi:hypothetical protein
MQGGVGAQEGSAEHVDYTEHAAVAAPDAARSAEAPYTSPVAHAANVPAGDDPPTGPVLPGRGIRPWASLQAHKFLALGVGRSSHLWDFPWPG